MHYAYKYMLVIKSVFEWKVSNSWVVFSSDYLPNKMQMPLIELILILMSHDQFYSLVPFLQTCFFFFFLISFFENSSYYFMFST